MPGLEVYLRETANLGDDVSMSTPEYIPLHLPSSLPSEKRPSVYVRGLAEVEDRLRYAQASEALTELRCQLTKRTYASRYRTANISSQTHYTRFRELKDQTDSKIKAACSRYKLARRGLVNLRGKGDWEKKLQELHVEDVRGLSEKALVNVFDPQVSPDQIWLDLAEANPLTPLDTSMFTILFYLLICFTIILFLQSRNKLPYATLPWKHVNMLKP